MDNQMEASTSFTRGAVISAGDSGFRAGLQAAVDYRGDCTVTLKGGQSVEGFLYNCDGARLDLFPRNSPRAVSVPIDEITSVVFSGEDTASGKSWEDWMKKKELEKESHNRVS